MKKPVRKNHLDANLKRLMDALTMEELDVVMRLLNCPGRYSVYVHPYDVGRRSITPSETLYLFFYWYRDEVEVYNVYRRLRAQEL
jgi:hypothetical protein